MLLKDTLWFSKLEGMSERSPTLNTTHRILVSQMVLGQRQKKKKPTRRVRFPFLSRGGDIMIWILAMSYSLRIDQCPVPSVVVDTAQVSPVEISRFWVHIISSRLRDNGSLETRASTVHLSSVSHLHR